MWETGAEERRDARRGGRWYCQFISYFKSFSIGTLAVGGNDRSLRHQSHALGGHCKVSSRYEASNSTLSIAQNASTLLKLVTHGRSIEAMRRISHLVAVHTRAKTNLAPNVGSGRQIRLHRQMQPEC